MTGGHLGYMQIKKVAQSCRFGNQIKFVIEPHANTNPSKNSIGKDISRFLTHQVDYKTAINYNKFKFEFKIISSIAQLVERLTSDGMICGSNPVWGELG